MIKSLQLKVFFLMLYLAMIVSCNTGPKPIIYGTDGCHYCSMTIVDTQHAAEFVTKKGKTYKFDAVECMMNHLRDIDNSTIATFLVNDYQAPGELIDARTAVYLYSKEIPSPMGEFITAFGTKEGLEKARAEHSGEHFNWDGLKARFKVK